MAKKIAALPARVEAIQHAIVELRGSRVILDADLAAFYGVPTGRLNEAVRRNASRFPADFMFQLVPEEAALISQIAISKVQKGSGEATDGASLISQIAISNAERGSEGAPGGNNLKSQIVISSSEKRAGAAAGGPALISQFVISKVGRGGRRKLPLAFTEQGVAMLSSVLRSETAIKVNIEIMRAFVRVREMMASNQDLARRLGDAEKRIDRHDGLLAATFDQFNKMLAPAPAPKKPPIGFTPRKPRAEPPAEPEKPSNRKAKGK